VRDLAPGRRLLLIAGALALALCGVSALVSWQAYDRQREVVARETAALARAAASNAGRFVTDRLALLEAVASAPPVVATDAAAVDRYFRLVNRGQRFSGGIGFVDRSGRVRAHSRIDDLRRRVVRAGDRDYFRAVMATGRPFVGRAVLARSDRRPIVVLAVPASGRDGAVSGVVIGSLLLDRLEATVRDLRYATSSIRILDRADREIVADQTVDRLRAYVSSAPLTAMRGERRGFRRDVRTPRGARLIAFAGVPAAGWLVLVERDEDAALIDARRSLERELGILILIALVGLGGAAAIGRRLDRVHAERAEMHAQTQEVAIELQRSLLPTVDGLPPGVGLAVRYTPAVDALAVGGDWYDVVDLGDGRVAITVGDVVGHGVRAAAAMGQVRSAVRALAPIAGGPSALMARLDPFVETIGEQGVCTVAYAVIELASGELRYACAGHPPPLLVAGDGTARYLEDGRSTPLGTGLDAERGEGCQRLAPGDTLVLYTDGLVERRGRTLQEGLDAVAAIAARVAGDGPDALADALLRELDTGRDDDVAILCLRTARVPVAAAVPASRAP